METKLIKLTDKGQISIPTSMQKATGLKKGDEMIAIQEGNIIILEKVKKSNFKDLVKHSEKVAAKLWGTKEDDVWDTV
mgnify:CR=1 FL=1